MVNYCSHNNSEDIFHDYAVFRDRTASASSSSSSNRSVSRSDAGDDGDGTSSGRDAAGGGGGGRGRSASKKGGRGKGRGGGRGKGSKKGTGGTGGHSDEMDDVTDTQDGAPDQTPGVSVAENNDTSAATLTAMDCSDIDTTTQGDVSEEQKAASTILLKSLQESSMDVDGVVKTGDRLGVIVEAVTKGEGDVVQSMAEDTMTAFKTEGQPDGVTKNASAVLDSQNPQGELTTSMPMFMAVVDPCTTSLSPLDVKIEADGQEQEQGERETGDCERDRKRRRVAFVEPVSVDTHTVTCREERGREVKMKSNGKSVQALQIQKAEEISCSNGKVVEEDAEEEEEEDRMVQCNECFRWVHALCEGIDQSQYEAMTRGTHPVWVRSSNVALTSSLEYPSCP